MFTTVGRFNIQISLEKEESVVIPKEPIGCKLAANNKQIQQTMQFEATKIYNRRFGRKEIKPQESLAT